MAEAEIKNIEDVLKLGKKVIEQKVARLTGPGENYGSLILKLDLVLEDETVLNLVAKCVPPSKEMQKIFNIDGTFKNEIGWYSEVIPTFQTFQRQNGIENVLNCFPKLYGSRLSLNPESNVVDNDGVILLENLAVQGFKTGNRLEGFNLETTKNTLRNLATFHAVSIALRLQDQAKFNAKVVPYLNGRNDDAPNFGPGILAFLEREQPEYKKYFSRIEATFNGSFTGSGKIREPWGAALHNDLWVNNLLIKHTDTFEELIFLDFQTCTYGSPVLDVVFLLTTSVALPIIKERFQELLQFYYDQFIEELKKLNVNVVLFSYESFEKELQAEGKDNFLHSLFFVLIVLVEKIGGQDTASKDFDPDGFIVYLTKNISEKQKQKILFLIDEFTARNWI